MKVKYFSQGAAVRLAGLLLVLAPRAGALVYCVTNAPDVHQSAPTGELANSGWQATAPIGLFLGTVIQSNALLTAKHLDFTNSFSFTHEGKSHTVTGYVNDAESDFAVLFFTPAATNIARLNIETNDAGAFVVLQGRGMERGDVVATGGRTNGWKWAWDKWWGIRRWGVNRYIGEADYASDSDGVLAVAAFDNNGDPDECMLSPGDSGGPGFIRTGSGWKLATVNYSVDPAVFTVSTNPVAAFNASLYDCAGLCYTNNGGWSYVPPEASPAPCLMFNSRTAARIAWITNAVGGITFPADVGVAWRCATNRPSAKQAAEEIFFDVVVTNAGPYAARGVTIDVSWAAGLRVKDCEVSDGAYEANRWSLSALDDGGTATLRVGVVVWRGSGGWATNTAAVSASDKPDGVASNNAASCEVYLPETATRLLVE